MENQHRKITGYRELDPKEIALMNEIKAKGAELAELLAKVQEHLQTQRYNCKCDAGQQVVDVAEWDRLESATPERFAAMAKTEFQTGLMYLTRAVARPTSF